MISHLARGGRGISMSCAPSGMSSATPCMSSRASISATGRTRERAMTYIGPRPQFDNGPRSVEPNLINWDGDLYDKVIAVHFVRWVRGDAKFASVDDLIAQMRQDQVDTLAVLASEG